MAGDWIKLEHATLDKPEIARIADLLNISTDAAIGLVIRFWVWADRNARNGRVTHMYAKSAENVMHCPGFVAAMTDVGWLEIDDKGGVLTIPHYERHNGSPAKTRALNAQRQKRHRHADSNAHVTLEALPEKRREENIRTRADQNQTPTAAAPPEWVDVVLWQQFREHRQRLKAPLTPKAESLLLAKLSRLVGAGEDAAKVLEQSIERGWKGLFPLDGEGHGRNTGSDRESRIGEQERIGAALAGKGAKRVIGD